MAGSSTSNMCLYFLAVLVPFLPVFFKTGCSCDLLINILLCCLGWIPGVIPRPSKISIGHQGVEKGDNGFTPDSVEGRKCIKVSRWDDKE
ncbi:hypothetical protein IFR05_013939 [Cadophora sp. M221]|nr:hypothetical protein IFR05_013939 [Cadophora sp. M221]